VSEVKIYRVTGKMRIGDTWQKFTMEIRALKKEHALEKVYSDLGSRHKLKRVHIRIEKVEEISPDEVTRPHIIQLLRLIS